MIATRELVRIAKARLMDADVLFENRRYSGAAYICGYALEIMLKYRICLTLGWDGYPDSGGEFNRYQTFRTHDLNVLLRLSGREAHVRDHYLREWSLAHDWSPETRYKIIGSIKKLETRARIAAIKTLMEEV